MDDVPPDLVDCRVAAGIRMGLCAFARAARLCKSLGRRATAFDSPAIKRTVGAWRLASEFRRAGTLRRNKYPARRWSRDRSRRGPFLLHDRQTATISCVAIRSHRKSLLAGRDPKD